MLKYQIKQQAVAALMAGFTLAGLSGVQYMGFSFSISPLAIVYAVTFILGMLSWSKCKMAYDRINFPNPSQDEKKQAKKALWLMFLTGASLVMFLIEQAWLFAFVMEDHYYVSEIYMVPMAFIAGRSIVYYVVGGFMVLNWKTMYQFFKH